MPPLRRGVDEPVGGEYAREAQQIGDPLGMAREADADCSGEHRATRAVPAIWKYRLCALPLMNFPRGVNSLSTIPAYPIQRRLGPHRFFGMNPITVIAASDSLWPDGMMAPSHKSRQRACGISA